MALEDYRNKWKKVLGKGKFELKGEISPILWRVKLHRERSESGGLGPIGKKVWGGETHWTGRSSAA